MRKFIVVLALTLAATAAHAQYGSSPGSFSIGPRVSNYSTDMDGLFAGFETGRQPAFGLTGDYRSGVFVLDFQWDHDPQNGINLTDILVDTGDYERNRGEVTAGAAIAPFLDIQGGLRLDQIRMGGISFLGNPVASDLDFDHTALTAGIRLHGDERQPVSFYLLARGYVGTAKFDVVNAANVDSDTTGWRGEVGIPIRLGQSNWRVVPGIEVEQIETKDYDIRIRTNRGFLNFVYRSR